jgi:hypothetical protein
MFIGTILLSLSLCPGIGQSQGATGQPRQYGELIPLTKEQQEEAEKKFMEGLRREWAPRLIKICEVEGIPAMVFTIVSPAYFEPWDQPHGVAAMRLLARSTSTFWSQENGVQVFSAVGERTDNFELAFYDLLQSLDHEGLEKLVAGDLRLGEIADPYRVVEGITMDPALAQVFLTRGAGATLQLSLEPRATYLDPKTGERRSIRLSADQPPVFLTEEKGGKPLFAFSPLETSQPGPLDFGEGKVITLGDFRAAAVEAFHTDYYLDGRLEKTLLFVRGSMDQDTFDKVYLKVGAATPPVRRPQSRALNKQELLDWLKSHPELESAWKGKQGVSRDEVLDGKTLSAADLAARNADFAAIIQARNLPPDTQLQLGIEVAFTIDAGGFRDLYPPYTGANGKTYHPLTTPNRMTFVVIGK